MDKLFYLGHFELKLSKTDEKLTLEAENQKTSEIFSKTITEDSTKNLSKDSFFDLPTIYHVLTDFFLNNPQSASLTISNDGKMTYNCQFSFGNIIKETGFVLELEKQEMDPMEKMEKTIARLSLKVSELEEQQKKHLEKANEPKGNEAFEKVLDQQLKNFERVILGKMNQLEKRIGDIEKRIQAEPSEREEEKINPIQSPPKSFIQGPQFDANCNQFTLSNNNKTIESRSVGGFILAKDRLEKNIDTKFSFLIDKTDGKLLGFGIAPKPFKKLQNSQGVHPFTDEATYMYYSSGCAWKRGSSQSLNLPVPQNGDIFTFIFEASNRNLIVYQNNKIVDTHNYSVHFFNSNAFYPFVFAGAAGYKVSFC